MTDGRDTTPPITDVRADGAVAHDDRLQRAKRRVQEQKELLAPSVRGQLGCGVVAVHAAALVLSLFVMVAPCSAALPFGGLVPALLAFGVGAIAGVPFVLKASRRARALFYERALRTLAKPALPPRAGGGATTTTAVSIAPPGGRSPADDDPSTR